MIGEAGTGRGFGGLVRYLMTGKDGDQPERVGWTETRNLMTDDPELVARIMRVTANVKGAGSRVENPLWHLSLSFALEDKDQLTRELETLVADRVLADMGLAEHQAFIVRHVDTDHAHVHIAVNRVHPETGKVWDNGHDWTRVEKSLRHQEKDLGLRQVPGHLHVLEDQQRPERDESLTSGQRRQAERTDTVPFAERVRAAAKEDLQTARCWQELAGTLAQHGLWTEKKGRGLVLTDGEEWVKASSVDRKASLAALEKKLGAYEHYGREYADRLRRQQEAQHAPLTQAFNAGHAQEQPQPEAQAPTLTEQFNQSDQPPERDRHAAKLREAELLWQEIVEPRQRWEDLQAAFEKSSRIESADRQAQVIDLEAERDRYEVKLREAKRQGQEVVEPRQPQAAAIAISTDAANDNRERQEAIAKIDRAIADESAALLKEQAQMRERLARQQDERRRLEEQERRQRFRTGILGLVDKFTGRHRDTEAQNAKDRERADDRDREQRLSLETEQTRQTAQLRQRHEQMSQQRQELERPRDLSQTFDVAATRESAQTMAHTPQASPGGGGGRSIKRAPVPYF